MDVPGALDRQIEAINAEIDEFESYVDKVVSAMDDIRMGRMDRAEEATQECLRCPTPKILAHATTVPLSVPSESPSNSTVPEGPSNSTVPAPSVPVVQDTRYWKECADQCFRNKLYTEAKGYYGNALDSLSNDPTPSTVAVQLYCNRALVNFRLCLYHECIQDCSAALKLRPDCCKALWRRASAAKELQLWIDAERDLLTLRDSDRNHVSKELGPASLQEIAQEINTVSECARTSEADLQRMQKEPTLRETVDITRKMVCHLRDGTTAAPSPDAESKTAVHLQFQLLLEHLRLLHDGIGPVAFRLADGFAEFLALLTETEWQPDVLEIMAFCHSQEANILTTVFFTKHVDSLWNLATQSKSREDVQKSLLVIFVTCMRSKKFVDAWKALPLASDTQFRTYILEHISDPNSAELVSRLLEHHKDVAIQWGLDLDTVLLSLCKQQQSTQHSLDLLHRLTLLPGKQERSVIVREAATIFQSMCRWVNSNTADMDGHSWLAIAHNLMTIAGIPECLTSELVPAIIRLSLSSLWKSGHRCSDAAIEWAITGKVATLEPEITFQAVFEQLRSTMSGSLQEEIATFLQTWSDNLHIPSAVSFLHALIRFVSKSFPIALFGLTVDENAARYIVLFALVRNRTTSKIQSEMKSIRKRPEENITGADIKHMANLSLLLGDLILSSESTVPLLQKVLTGALQTALLEEMVLCLRWLARLEYHHDIDQKFVSQAERNLSIACARITKLDHSGEAREQLQSLNGLALLAQLNQKMSSV